VRVTAVTLAALLLVAGNAAARDYVANPAHVTHALNIAQYVFEEHACPTDPQHPPVRYGTRDPHGVDLVETWTVARATWRIPPGSGNARDWFDCAITFNPQFRHHYNTWPEFCSVMLHEYGHLVGREHSSNPRSVMYPRPGVIHRACRPPRKDRRGQHGPHPPGQPQRKRMAGPQP